MSEQKQHENIFKFSVYQCASGENSIDELITERSFSADVFNPMARYSVNIKEIIPSVIKRLLKLFSLRNATYKIQYKDATYDLLALYKKQSSQYPEYNEQSNKLISPEIKTVNITDNTGTVVKTMTGVECKFCFFINNNMIVERLFYVDKFNPAVKFSTEIIDTVNDITDDIFEVIKKNDVNNIWDDLSIIKAYGFSHINNVRELKREQRDLYLKNINNTSFILSVQSEYRNSNTVETKQVED